MKQPITLAAAEEALGGDPGAQTPVTASVPEKPAKTPDHEDDNEDGATLQ